MAGKMKSPQMPNPYGLNMNLATAKKIAEQRHETMLRFLDQFINEWEGRDLE
jgi:hypothetical protein